MGVDLSAFTRNLSFISTIAFLKTSENWKFLGLDIARAKSNDDLVQYIISRSPRYVLIDAPLSIDNIDDKGFRPQDRCAIKLGARLLPLKTESMKTLGARGVWLKDVLSSQGLVVMETHPYSVARILNYSTTRELVMNVFGKSLNKGEADSVVAGLMGYYLDNGDFHICEGNPPLVLPYKNARRLSFV